MSLPPVVLFTTVNYEPPTSGPISRQDFQTVLHVVNMSCEEFISTPNMTLITRSGRLYRGTGEGNNQKLFHCTDGLVQMARPSGKYYKLPGPVTDPENSDKLRYPPLFEFKDADVKAALEKLANAKPPVIVYRAGNSASNVQGLHISLVTATLDELLTKQVAMFTLYKGETMTARHMRGALYYTADDQFAVCTANDDERPTFTAFVNVLNHKVIATFRNNPSADE